MQGTIPEDIMQTLGLDQKDWEARIRLLSASKRGRTVIGVKGDKNERDQIINTVEHHVKDEGSAEGLYYDDDEQLRPYAKPTTPRERLAFRAAQLALHRHYYTQELKSFDEQQHYPLERLANDRSMRLERALAAGEVAALHDLFASEDIGSKLLQSAATLKIANPEDPYPDEAVFGMTLKGGREVIIKKVVSDKQQGPIDEFEALLMLNKLGIDAPRPVARVFTEGQKGFLVMEKLAGSSGRVIDEYLKENNVSHENRQEILRDALMRMQEIAETVRRDTGLDKPWRLKDFMIEYEREGDALKIKTMRPIDFERAKVFDPANPHTVRLGQGLDV